MPLGSVLEWPKNMPSSPKFFRLFSTPYFMDYALLHQLCKIHAPAGNEVAMKDFLLDFVLREAKNWASQPEIIHGDAFQDCLLLVFGKPRTVVFAHIDSIGFTVRYNNRLVKIGGPVTETGIN
ncbi:MAG: hypothetical protein EOP53_21110, partial [Sphingobacteriales bacterium]